MFLGPNYFQNVDVSKFSKTWLTYVHKRKRGAGNLFSHGKFDFIQGTFIYFDCCSSSVFIPNR